MTNKLPSYFEKYMDNKFGEVQAQIAELKLHVNDEIEELRAQIESNQKAIYKIWIALVLLTPVYIKDSRDVVFGFLKQILGL